MGGTKEELKERMSAAEFEEWRVFYAIRPFGPWHDDYRIATLNHSVASMVTGKPLHIKDFRCIQPLPKIQSDAEIAAAARAAMRNI